MCELRSIKYRIKCVNYVRSIKYRIKCVNYVLLNIA